MLKLPRYSHTAKEDWTVFRWQFETVVGVNQYDDLNARMALSSVMDGAAALVTMDINRVGGNLTLQQLMNRYEERFLPPAASQLAMMRFDAAYQAPKESEVRWHARLRAIYMRAYPNAVGGADVPQLIRKFVIGLKNAKIREQTLRNGPATYALALDSALGEKAVVEVQQVMQGGLQGGMGLRANRDVIDDEEPMDLSSLLAALKDIQCFGCGLQGHVKRNCPHRDRWPAYEKEKERNARATSRFRKRDEKDKKPPPRWGAKRQQRRQDVVAALSELLGNHDDDDDEEEDQGGDRPVGPPPLQEETDSEPEGAVGGHSDAAAEAAEKEARQWDF